MPRLSAPDPCKCITIRLQNTDIQLYTQPIYAFKAVNNLAIDYASVSAPLHCISNYLCLHNASMHVAMFVYVHTCMYLCVHACVCVCVFV